EPHLLGSPSAGEVSQQATRPSPPPIPVLYHDHTEGGKEHEQRPPNSIIAHVLGYARRVCASGTATIQAQLAEHSKTFRAVGVREYKVDRVGEGDPVYDDLTLRSRIERGQELGITVGAYRRSITLRGLLPVDPRGRPPGERPRRFGRRGFASARPEPGEQVDRQWIAASGERSLHGACRNPWHHFSLSGV
ncbi:MAG TPA: hypothetical protein VHG35_01910, partial [Gemmatimonadales bacterium]|nr:hypothetical protein [Gemmatimonadales bacterium]